MLKEWIIKTDQLTDDCKKMVSNVYYVQGVLLNWWFILMWS